VERIAPCCWSGPFDNHWEPDGACRKKAFLWSFSSGVSEILGAGLAAIVLMPFLSERVMGFVLAGVAGIMVVISLDELIPVAKSFDAEHTPIMGVIIGMIVMVLSLWMLGQT